MEREEWKVVIELTVIMVWLVVEKASCLRYWSSLTMTCDTVILSPAFAGDGEASFQRATGLMVPS